MIRCTKFKCGLFLLLDISHVSVISIYIYMYSSAPKWTSYQNCMIHRYIALKVPCLWFNFNHFWLVNVLQASITLLSESKLNLPPPPQTYRYTKSWKRSEERERNFVFPMVMLYTRQNNIVYHWQNITVKNSLNTALPCS